MELTFEVLKERDQRWSLRLLQIEAAQLTRERQHLIFKSKERALEQWELGRLEESARELRHLSAVLSLAQDLY